MANGTRLIGGDVVEDLDTGLAQNGPATGVKRQIVTIGDRGCTGNDSIGPTNEAAPETDTAPVGLNGRLQRIAQNISTMITSVLSVKILDGNFATFGTKVDAADSHTDTTSVSAMSVLKSLSASLQATQAVAVDTSAMVVGNTATKLTPKFAIIAAANSGATTIIPAVTGKKIRVLAAKIVANGGVNVKWQSHFTPTDLTGLSYYAAAGDGEVLPFNPVGWFQTNASEALDINLSGAIAVGGHLTYIEV